MPATVCRSASRSCQEGEATVSVPATVCRSASRSFQEREVTAHVPATVCRSASRSFQEREATASVPATVCRGASRSFQKREVTISVPATVRHIASRPLEGGRAPLHERPSGDAVAREVSLHGKLTEATLGARVHLVSPSPPCSVIASHLTLTRASSTVRVPRIGLSLHRPRSRDHPGQGADKRSTAGRAQCQWSPVLCSRFSSA